MVSRVLSIALIVPLNVEVSAVVVVVHANLLVEHLIRPEPETAKIFIILKNVKLVLNRTEPVSNLGRNVERSAVNILILVGGIITKHANLGKILFNRMLHVDKEVTILLVLVTDSIIKALELSGLKRNTKKVIHEVLVKAGLGDIVLFSVLKRGMVALLATHEGQLPAQRKRASSQG